MQLLSQSAQYAVSAVIALARQPNNNAISAADLAGPLNCPAAYLSQVLAKLRPSGIIESRRGLKGGVFLAKSVDRITLYDIVTAIDGEEFFERCILGIKGCGTVEPCPFHEIWSVKRNEIQTWLSNTTISDTLENLTDAWFDLRLKFNHQRSE